MADRVTRQVDASARYQISAMLSLVMLDLQNCRSEAIRNGRYDLLMPFLRAALDRTIDINATFLGFARLMASRPWLYALVETRSDALASGINAAEQYFVAQHHRAVRNGTWRPNSRHWY